MRQVANPLLERMKEFNTSPQKIPLFPLNTVLFPDGLISLKIFEARYLDMIKKCLRDKTEFGVISMIKNPDIDNQSLSFTFANIGTLALIQDFDPIQPALYMTKSLGSQRFKLLKFAQESSGLWMGEVELMENDPLIPIPQAHLGMSKLLGEIISTLQSNDLPSDAIIKKPFRLDDCGWVSNRIAEILQIPLAQKNHLLAQTNPRIRLDLIAEIIEDDDFNKIMMH